MEVAKDYVGHSYTVKELRRAYLQHHRRYVNVIPGDVVYIVDAHDGTPVFSLSRDDIDRFSFDRALYTYRAPANETEFMQVYGLQPLALQKARDLFAD